MCVAVSNYHVLTKGFEVQWIFCVLVKIWLCTVPISGYLEGHPKSVHFIIGTHYQYWLT